MPSQLSDKLYNWASIIDGVTLDQAFKTSKLDIVWPHLALMPDAHLGKGATVGSVIPTLESIIPAAVGVDIGCGMIAVKTDVKKEVLQALDLRQLHKLISDRVPVSAGGYNQKVTKSAQKRIEQLKLATKDYSKVVANWEMQLGTLGSGNHFIEISYDQEGFVWAFLHSGSRGIGNKIAQGHIKKARDLCAHMSLEDRDLSYLFEGQSEFDEYMIDLRWAQEFALLNRQEMMDRVLDALQLFIIFRNITFSEPIQCHHNFTEYEHHFGTNLWISRKGAILAEKDEWGLIPGSMGTASYIVKGLANPMSFNSAPHGAGRVYSRGKAKATFTLEQLEERMGNIVYTHSASFLDEIPDAYKDVNQVIEDASDLVTVENVLHQLVNVKGT